MELKNAFTICLISLVSATLVVLIARSLDSQAAARLEPQLTRIVEELEALRKQGGVPAAISANRPDSSVSDGLLVYYLHSNTRCPTCRSIESQAEAVVHSDFAAELKSGAVTWKVVNYESPSAADLAKKFEIQNPVVVLARMQGGEIAQWKRLDRVWGLVGDKARYASYLRDEIRQMVRAAEPESTLTPTGNESEAKAAKETTTAAAEASEAPPADLPIPQ